MHVDEVKKLTSADDSYGGTVGDYVSRKREHLHDPELLESVREHGIVFPLYRVDDRLDNGHHRFAAALEAGLTHVPVSEHYPSTRIPVDKKAFSGLKRTAPGWADGPE